MDDLFVLIRQLRHRGPIAVATVVQITGSAYRREGARAVFTASGETFGAISGGCLESDVAEVAAGVIATGEPRLLRYDNTADDDLVWGMASGCNGIVEILVEAVPPLPSPADGGGSPVPDLYSTVESHRLAGVPVAVATVVASTVPGVPVLARMLVTDRDRCGELGAVGLGEQVARDAVAQLAAGRSRTVAYPLPAGAVRVFLEAVFPPPRLLIFGAGNDAIPVTAAAHTLGYEVTVVDPRPQYATDARFPAADRVLCLTPADARTRVELDAATAVLLMTHHFHRDVELLAWLLPANLRYLGVLGPRDRTEKLLEAVRRRGLQPTAAQLERLYSPVGLDIGGETPAEIAASILAEIQAVHFGRPGTHLRQRQQPLHA